MEHCLSGQSYPLGATVQGDGVNFSVYSKGSNSVELLLFDHVDDVAPSETVRLNAPEHRTFHYWHAFVPGIRPGQLYGYRVHGPFLPNEGLRFDPTKSLLDPYGRAVARPLSYNRQALSARDARAPGMKNVVVDSTAYDWGDDAPPRKPFAKSVIYELHIGGFTKHPSSGVPEGLQGTYGGLLEKIPYLRDLGVTAVELLPAFAFDEQDCPTGLANYWGYSPVSFFAPHPGYSSAPAPEAVLDQFRDMVKGLHRAGVEVLLDVVFNHTAEGDANGPTLSFRGLANQVYYILDDDQAAYRNYSGCGNTFNANHPICRRMILDSLRYWASEMHVDGFRFDLASVLTRDEHGRPMRSAPVLWDIESDPVLCNVKLIAEPWDAVGLYEVGNFLGDSWREWNGRFRDDVRAFIRGDCGKAVDVANRLTGSPDLYQHKTQQPDASINFVACHDGFTLNDLVSHNAKHNLPNGEENRDGTDENLSWNCGVEGPTTDCAVERLRNRQVKNFLALTLLSVGTPMLLSGDEVRRSQAGNNNAYCQDNETSWFDWSVLVAHGDIHRFAKQLIGLRLSPAICVESLSVCLGELLRDHPVAWHGVQLNKPDWSHESHTLAASVRIEELFDLHLIINAYWECLEFELPTPQPGFAPWRRIIDTFREAPDDIQQWDDAELVRGSLYLVHERSLVLLMSKKL